MPARGQRRARPRPAKMSDARAAAHPQPLYERPRARVAEWAAIGAAPRVVRVLQDGLRLRFWRDPPPYDGGEIPIPPSDIDWVEEEIEKNVLRGSWREAQEKPQHCAPAFIVRRADGKRRVVIDLRFVNSHLRGRGVRYDTLKALRYLLPPGGFMISFDLESGYHHIGVHEDSQRYLGFQLAGRYFYCAALPFGLSTAPRVFTKVMRALVAHLRGQGVRCLPYLDDFLFAFNTQKQAKRAATTIDALLLRLGLARNKEKGCWRPTQRLQHLGMIIDSRSMSFEPTPAAEARVREFSSELLHLATRRARVVPARMVAKFAGLAISLHLAVPLARMATRALFDALATKKSWSSRVRLSSAALTDLRWWQSENWGGGAPIALPRPTLTVATDASDLAWGAAVENEELEARGYFAASDAVRTIAERELLAVLMALRAFRERLRNQEFRLLIDNQAAAFGLINMTMRSAGARQLLRDIWSEARNINARILVQWIPTWANTRADALSRVVDREDYQLHPALFQELCQRWGTPDVDMFATALNAQVPRFWAARPDPAAEAVDGLAQPLQGLHVYANPPWSLIAPLLERLRNTPECEATLVLPFWASALWYPALADIADELQIVSPTAETFLPGFCGNARGIGRPRWAVLFAHIPRRA